MTQPSQSPNGTNQTRDSAAQMQKQQGQNLSGPPEGQQTAINPSSSQGGQAQQAQAGSQDLPSRTQPDPTRTAGSTGTQLDQDGRSLGAQGRQTQEQAGDGQPQQEQQQPPYDQNQANQQFHGGKNLVSDRYSRGPHGTDPAQKVQSNPGQAQPGSNNQKSGQQSNQQK